jgi:hypothetical protein
MSSLVQAKWMNSLGALLQPVLDRLHVVVGRALDVLDRLRIGFREAQHQAAQQPARGFGQRRELGEAGVRQRDEPLHLDLHAAVHQAELRQQRAQRIELGGVAAVERRQGGERGQRHGRWREEFGGRARRPDGAAEATEF